VIERRAPGQRRRRSRREDELAQVEALDPDRAAELVELRRYNPQAFRKELLRMIRAGTIQRGRGFQVHGDQLALLGPDDAAAVVDSLARAMDSGELGFRELAGLREAERGGRGREEVLRWLEQRYEEQLERDNRSPVQVTQR
jgi:hypothetical protein